MADVIQLLPDSIANQIAAGEVIQRPASVVKELLENAIDAGSTEIKLIIKDAGKSLIQIVDNGCGMSATDARLSFERHATSKIRSAEDLFSIRTMGFRGEALASLAAVAQVEMKTKQSFDELGTKIIVEGSEIKKQEACQATDGTSIAVKNLFYNIPARRNFLKSDNVELKHITDEFHRVALAHPDVFFSMHHNGKENYHLMPGNLRQRIIGILGPHANKKLVPVFEETDVVKFSGFVGKPEFARKTRGDQWFFVNERFIKSHNLNQAIVSAYENILPSDSYPLYVIFIEMDPSRIDINVHPTKQEIKFEDEKLVYNYLRVAVRHALGQHSITPSIDFDQEVSFTRTTPIFPDEPTKGMGQESTSKDLFSKSGGADSGKPKDQNQYRSKLKDWEQFYKELHGTEPTQDGPAPDQEISGLFDEVLPAVTIESKLNQSEDTEANASQAIKSNIQSTPYQIHQMYIVSHIKSGFLLIDQQNAHERILYEQFLRVLNEQEAPTQQQLFPKTIETSPADTELLTSILPEINLLGFEIEPFGQNAFVINGVPAVLNGKVNELEVIEKLLDQYKQNLDLQMGANENIARAMSRSAAIRRGQSLSTEEMQSLINQLFACALPFKSPTGKTCFITYELDELRKQFDS